MNKVIRIDEHDLRYASMIKEVENMNSKDLIIVARSEINRKADEITPICIKNGIYFYAAYKIDSGLAFPAKVTEEDIFLAKVNTMTNARLGSMADVLLGNGYTLDVWEPYGDPMICLTTGDKSNGAGILLCGEYLMQIKGMIGKYRILPSSIHEVLIVPDSSGVSKEQLDSMVMEVNMLEVSDQDHLGDRSFTVDEWC